MSTSNPKITLKPGGTITLPPGSGPFDIEAEKCPVDAPSGSPWPFPKGVAALRVSGDVIGAISAEDLSPQVADELEPAGTEAERLPEMDADVTGVLELGSTVDVLRTRGRHAPVRVLLASDRSLSPYRPLLDAAEARGEGVEFVIVPRPNG